MRVTGDKEYLGRGWAFPPRWGGDGVATTAAEEDIRQAIRIILRTIPGERVMRPDFGADVDRYVFAERTVATAAMLESDVHKALLRWEPRISLESVRAELSPDEESRIDVFIDYTIDALRRPDSLVFPYYVNQKGESS